RGFHDVQKKRHGAPRSRRPRNVTGKKTGRGRDFARRNPLNSFNLTSIPAKLQHANSARRGISRGHAAWPLRPERQQDRTRMTTLAAARLTLVHDWLTGYRGGEKSPRVPLPP